MNYKVSSRKEYRLTILRYSEKPISLMSVPDAKIIRMSIAALEIASEMPPPNSGNMSTQKL